MKTRSAVDLPQPSFPWFGEGLSIDNPAQQEHSMMDVLMVVLAFGCFAAALGYTYVCERL